MLHVPTALAARPATAKPAAIRAANSIAPSSAIRAAVDSANGSAPARHSSVSAGQWAVPTPFAAAV